MFRSVLLTAMQGLIVKKFMEMDGQGSSFLLTGSGKIYAWGYNGGGFLGLGNKTTYYEPQLICSGCGCKFCDISVGYYHVLALKDDGNVLSWGCNIAGALGNCSYITTCSPVTVCGGYTFCYIFASYFTSYGILTNGCGLSWGCGNQGQLGDGTAASDSCFPVYICCNYQYCKIVGGQYNGYGLKTDGKLVSWGRQICGALGNNAITDVIICIPQNVCCDYCYTDVAATYDRAAIAIRTDGCAYSFGHGLCYQTGLNTTSYTSNPSPVCCNYQYCYIHASLVTHSVVAIKTTGQAVGWGENICGNLGVGSCGNKQIPTSICCNCSFSCIFQGSYFATHGITTSKQVLSWGELCYHSALDGNCSPHISTVPVSACSSYLSMMS